MPLTLGNPEHWRQRAEEARRQALQMDDATAKLAMFAVAASYDKIADRAEAAAKIANAN